MTGATIQLIRGPKVSDGEKKRQSNQCHRKSISCRVFARFLLKWPLFQSKALLEHSQKFGINHASSGRQIPSRSLKTLDEEVFFLCHALFA